MKKIIFVSLFALIIFAPLYNARAAAAGLLISTSKDSFSVGDVFNVQISVISGNNELQLVRAKVAYPADLLLAQGFKQGELFPQKSPGESIGKGIVYVGGYRLGDATNANGLLGEISFKVLKAGTANLSLISGSRMITPEIKDIYVSSNNITLSLMPNAAMPKITSAKKIIGWQAPEIKSSTNPEDTWEKSSSVILKWTARAGALGYVAKLSQDIKEDIGTDINTKTNSLTYDNVADGIWVFQLRAKYAAGLSPIAYYTVKIDSTPPVEPQPVVESKLDSSNKALYQIIFNTTDATSGIDHYEIRFDNGEFENATSPYVLNSSEKEANFVYVKAIDLAGNESSASAIVADYLNQKNAKALFDIQANSAKRAWTEFYFVLALIILVFVIILIGIFLKKRK